MSSSDDEDLQKAIAMSLGQLDGIAEDERASAAGAVDDNTSEAPPTHTTDPATNSTQLSSTRAANESLKTLDRKQLEAERLARQKARKHQAADSSPSSQHPGNPGKRRRTEPAASSSQDSSVIDLTTPPRLPSQAPPPKQRREPSPTRLSRVRSQSQAIRQALQSEPIIPTLPETAHTPVSHSSHKVTEPQYLHGAIKRTWARGFPRDNDIKIEELLQKNDLNHLLVSTFNFDTEWWSTKINPQVTKQTWIVGSSFEHVAHEWKLAPAIYPNVSVSLADMKAPSGNHHAKFLIGAHPKYLRIAVTSANLTEFDWGESGVMENTVFLIDLPRLPEGQTTSEGELTPFGKELRHYLSSVTDRPNLCNSLLKFDWSRTQHLAFVHSLKGTRTGEDAQRTGVLGLARAIRQLNLSSTLLEVDYASSSLGALSKAFMTQLLSAAKGEVAANSEKYDQDVKMGDTLKRFRVYFPTVDTIAASRGGSDSAGTITFSKRWYDASSFPKAAMHDHKSTRRGLLSHNKIMIGRGQRESPSAGAGEDEAEATLEDVAWVYVGSANLTAAAWGQVTYSGKPRSAKITCRNYECGVLVPVKEESLKKKTKEGEVPGYDVFKDTVDIPFDIPSDKIGDKTPWFC